MQQLAKKVMALSMDENKPKHPGGRPKKTEEISIDKICEIMLEAASRGSFFQQLPYEIYKETKVKLSHSWLDKQKDEEFLRTKSIAMAMCTKYWTEMISQAAIPAAMWVFIMKNVGNWRDQKEIAVSDADLDKKTELDSGERKARIELIKKMAAEVK